MFLFSVVNISAEFVVIGEGLFSFDEDMVPEKETGNLNEGSAMSGLFYTDQPNGSFSVLCFYPN